MTRRALAAALCAAVVVAPGAAAQPATGPLTVEAARVHGWLAARGYRVQPLPVSEADILGTYAVPADGLTFTDRIVVDTQWAAFLGGRLSPRAAQTVHILVHEALHTIRAPQGLAVWGPAERALEEAVVEAVARDESTRYMQARYGETFAWIDGAYESGVRMVRGVSARASCRPPGSRAAWVWRRALVNADDQARAAVWQAGVTNKCRTRRR